MQTFKITHTWKDGISTTPKETTFDNNSRGYDHKELIYWMTMHSANRYQYLIEENVKKFKKKYIKEDSKWIFTQEGIYDTVQTIPPLIWAPEDQNAEFQDHTIKITPYEAKRKTPKAQKLNGRIIHIYPKRK